MWSKYLALWVIIFAVAGYFLSMAFGSAEDLTLENTSVIYSSILIAKTIFFSSLKMLVTPLVFVALVSGFLQMAEVKSVGRLGRVTLLYYLATTSIAIIIGLAVVFIGPNWKSSERSLDLSSSTSLVQEELKAPISSIKKSDANLSSVLLKMVKQIFVNPFEAMVSNNLLGIVFWAFLTGLAFLKLDIEGNGLKDIFQSSYSILNKILSWVILFSPIGVFAVAYEFQLKFSGSIIKELLEFCFIVFGATLLHGVVVLPGILKIVTGMSIRSFFIKAAKPLALAFTTSSSAATLPVSLQVCEEEFGIPNSVSSFVLPLGATMNMDGTALFEGVAAVFLAYVFGIDLGTIGILSVFFMAVVSSIGAPGMPSGSMAGMQMVLVAAGIPLEGIALLLLVERPLDTFRTAVNVEGDLIGALIATKYVKEVSK